MRDAFPPHLDLQLSALFDTLEFPFPVLSTLFRALPFAGTLFRHPRRIITEVFRNVRAIRRLRITKYPRCTPFGQSAAKEGMKGTAGLQGQRHRGGTSSTWAIARKLPLRAREIDQIVTFVWRLVRIHSAGSPAAVFTWLMRVSRTRGAYI